MQGALASSDLLLTVSSGYARELVQDPAVGMGLHDMMSSQKVRCTINLCKHVRFQLSNTLFPIVFSVSKNTAQGYSGY